MNEKLTVLTDESIQLELLVSELYLDFYNLFPDDAKFWWRLVEEERNHASLIRSALEYFDPIDQFPDKLISHSLSVLKESNGKLRDLITKFRNSPPKRAEAFNCAFKLERTAGELHFQKFLNDRELNVVEKIFQKLNGDDGEHADRIREYMNNNGIPFEDNMENCL
ncbi:MAG: hypothetical protein JW863_11715 [Chitinispirillaceae bacterium]|nr:hypothetical protein [Chitinispirillaceae bacterium]